MLISNGWTDDLFPPDEAIRFYNRTRTSTPARRSRCSSSTTATSAARTRPIDTALPRHARRTPGSTTTSSGTGPQPFQGVQTLTQTCPDTAPRAAPPATSTTSPPTRRSAPPTWAALAPGEVRFDVGRRSRRSSRRRLDPASAQRLRPDRRPRRLRDRRTAPTSPASPPTASPAAPAGGYTLMGSPTMVADIDADRRRPRRSPPACSTSQPDGNETLVARGLYRPDGDRDPTQVFQLHPNGWKFAQGHVAKLELLPADSPYGRASNGQGRSRSPISSCACRCSRRPAPARSRHPAAKVLPPGYKLAIDYLPARTGGPQPPAGGGRYRAAADTGAAGAELRGLADPRQRQGRQAHAAAPMTTSSAACAATTASRARRATTASTPTRVATAQPAAAATT